MLFFVRVDLIIGQIVNVRDIILKQIHIPGVDRAQKLR